MSDIDSLIQQLSAEAIYAAYKAGYDHAMEKALSRMWFVASVVPGSVTKQWVIDEIGRQAGELARTALQEAGDDPKKHTDSGQGG